MFSNVKTFKSIFLELFNTLKKKLNELSFQSDFNNFRNAKFEIISRILC